MHCIKSYCQDFQLKGVKDGDVFEHRVLDVGEFIISVCGYRMNNNRHLQLQQQVPGTLVNVTSVSDVEGNELFRVDDRPREPQMVQEANHDGGRAAIAILDAGRQVRGRARTTGFVSDAVAASCYDDCATHGDVS